MSIPDAFRKRGGGGGKGSASGKLKASESLASSISNLHRVVTGAQDLTKVLLTDDYFSDVNPRSMRRLMNIVYITGRLLKAFNIDFNWYHLASWVNITEQWPYRTSWIIMYYEMHESEFDEMLPLKTVYERIKCFMPVSKEEEPTLDLDHDERKFEVFLSFHSSSLLINDLKVFLPFTINLDPYIRKVIQENHQEVSEFLKIDLKPSNSPPSKGERSRNFHSRRQQLLSPIHSPEYQKVMRRGKGNLFHQQMAPSPPAPFATSPPWWSYQNEQTAVHPSLYPAVSQFVCLPDGQELSDLNVDGVASLLRTQHNMSSVESCVAAIHSHNINGQVLLTCDLRELKETLAMSFGDWELFRVLILRLREQEFTSASASSFCHHSKDNRPGGCVEKSVGPVRVNSQRQHKVETTLKPSLSISPEPKAKDSTTASTTNTKVTENTTESSHNIPRRQSTVLEKQVTMEESMIVGALETLNEDAQEDAMEEQTLHSRKPSGNPLSPILSDPEETVNKVPEVDTLFLQSSPMLRVSAISLSDSLTDIETSSLGKCHNFIENNSPPISRKSDSDANQSRKQEAKNAIQRPSSLVCDGIHTEQNSESATVTKNDTSKLKGHRSIDNKSLRKCPEKTNMMTTTTIHHRMRHTKRKSTSKSDSSDSSTETEEKPRHTNQKLLPTQKSLPNQKSLPTPNSDADGFFSDDEHTPLVSPFHVNLYNLQSSKSEKESTPEKSIPRQSEDHKIRNPLERQYSVDSHLCERANRPATSTSMGEIVSQTLVDGLSVYDHHVSDSSPEYQHNETIL